MADVAVPTKHATRQRTGRVRGFLGALGCAALVAAAALGTIAATDGSPDRDVRPAGKAAPVGR